jgi:lysophospholipase L1-like esterase
MYTQKLYRFVQVNAMRRALQLSSFLLLAILPGTAIAQNAPGAPVAAPPPAATPATTPAVPATPAPPPVADPHLHQLLTDWPQLERYRAANALLPAPAPEEKRVVFYGDSITDGWPLFTYFPGKPYVNRGISGQTTPQMLVRFREDVIALKPRVVVILAGTNDVAQNTGPETLEQIEDNFASMCDLAKANGIRVVLSSILPAYEYPWRPGMDPVTKIAALNQWLRDYAAAHGYVYLDYYSAMQDARHGLPENLSRDGVHPNAAGYAVMAPLAEKAIGDALR